MKYLVFILTFILASCGSDGGSGNSNAPPERPSASISGTAFDGLIINGNIKIYDFSDGIKGQVLGTSTTDSSGFYEIEITSPDTPLLLEVCGGRYVEEASGLSVQLQAGQCLFGLYNYISGESINMALTYFSMLATGYAECLINNENFAVPAAIGAANQLASNLAGYDITSVQPLDVTLPQNATAFISNEITAGMYAAGISQMLFDVSVANGQTPHLNYNSIYFANQITYNDVKDCLLDGVGEDNEQLSMGVVPVTPEHYRYLQARGMLEFINSNRNATGLGVNDFTANITRFNSTTNSTLSQPVVEINGGTTINNFTPADGAIVNNTITISAQLTDSVGILRSRFLINDQEVAVISRNNNPSFEIDTTTFGSGNFVLTIEVTNDLLVETSVDQNITFSNGAPSISNVTPSNLTRVNGSVNLSADVASITGLSVVRLLVDGNQLTSFTNPVNGNFSQTFDTTALPDGEHQFTVRAEDIIAQTSEQTSVVTVDNTAPTISNVLPANGDYVSGSFNFSANVSDLAGVSNSRVLFAGQQFVPLSLSSPNVLLNSQLVSDGSTEVTIEATDSLGNVRTFVRTVNVDNAPPSVSNFVPLEGEVLSGTVTLSATVSDANGISSVEYLLDGSNLTFAAVPSNPSQSFNSANYPDGSHTITIVVTDNSGKQTTLTRNVLISNTPLSFSISTQPTSITTEIGQTTILVNRQASEIASFNMVAQLDVAGGQSLSITTASSINGFSGYPSGAVFVCHWDDQNDNNEFVKVTLTVTDIYGRQKSQAWDRNNSSTLGRACVGEMLSLPS